MAKDTKDPTAHAQAPEATFDRGAAEGLTNVAAKLPVYTPLLEGGDARTLRLGTKGAPIHGYFLGSMNLPSTQTEADGVTPKPWVGIVIELLQPCPVKEGSAENVTRRMAKKGERVIFTESTAFQRFTKVADHGSKVFEGFVEPKVGQNKKGQRLWMYEDVRFGRPLARTDQHIIAAESLVPDEEELSAAPSVPALPQHATS